MKKLLTITALLLTVSLLAGCGGQKAITNKQTYRIGAIFPLTGGEASFGEYMKNGAEMALEEINKEYDFNLEIVYEDTQGQPANTVSAVRELIDIQKVKLLVGPARSNCTLAAAPIVEGKKVVMLTPIASAEEITKSGDYIFRNREMADSHGVAMAKFLYEDLGKRRTAVLFANAANAITYKNWFEEEFQRLGGEIVYSEGYIGDNLDFKTPVAKIKATNPDTIYLSATQLTDMAQAIKQIRDMDIDVTIATTALAENSELIEVLGQQAEGLIYSAPYFNLEDEQTAKYAKKFRDKYGKDSNLFAANTYDALHIYAMLINKCGGDKPECIKNELYKVKDYPGVGGPTTFDENGDVDKPIMIKIVKDGQFVKYEE